MTTTWPYRLVSGHLLVQMCVVCIMQQQRPAQNESNAAMQFYAKPRNAECDEIVIHKLCFFLWLLNGNIVNEYGCHG